MGGTETGGEGHTSKGFGTTQGWQICVKHCMHVRDLSNITSSRSVYRVVR